MMFRLLTLTLYWVCLVYSEGSKESIGLVQLYDCTCAGYTQTYKCTIFEGGTTIWQGSAFECSGQVDRIQLRHSTFESPPGATGECNGGAIMARSVGVVNGSCYVSILNVTVGEEMDNRTIECARHDLSSQTNTTYGVNLDIIQAPYAPPGDIRYEKMEPDRLQFSWSKVAPHCPYVQYIITARNCGICPNTTVDATVTCTNYSSSENSTCLFAVQTETCGSILGEMSGYLEIVLNTTNSEEAGIATLTSFTTLSPGSQERTTHNAIVGAVISLCMALLIIALLLTVVFAVLIFKKKYSHGKTAPNSSLRQQNLAIDSQDVDNGVYSFLQPSEENESGVANRDCQDQVVYADIGQDHNMRVPMFTCPHDDKVAYATVLYDTADNALEHEFHSATDVQSDSSVPFDFLLKLASVTTVAEKWYDFGKAVGLNDEILESCLDLPPSEAIVEVFDYWLRNHNKATWMQLKEAMTKIELHDQDLPLLTIIPEWIVTNSDSISYSKVDNVIEQAPPIPPKVDDQAPPIPLKLDDQAPPIPPKVNDQAPPIPPKLDDQAPPIHPKLDDQAPPIKVDDQGPPVPPKVDDQAPPIPPKLNDQGPPIPPKVDDQGPPIPPKFNDQGPPIPPKFDDQAPHIPPKFNDQGPPIPPKFDDQAPPIPPKVEDQQAPPVPPKLYLL